VSAVIRKQRAVAVYKELKEETGMAKSQDTQKSEKKQAKKEKKKG
jgi:hypothetical protein